MASICPPSDWSIGFYASMSLRPPRPQSAPYVKWGQVCRPVRNGRSGASAARSPPALLFTADPVLEAEGQPTRASPPPLGPRSSTSLHRWRRRWRSKGLTPVSGPPQANDATRATATILPPLAVAIAPGNMRFHVSLAQPCCAYRSGRRAQLWGARSPTHLGGGLHPVLDVAPQSIGTAAFGGVGGRAQGRALRELVTQVDGLILGAGGEVHGGHGAVAVHLGEGRVSLRAAGG